MSDEKTNKQEIVDYNLNLFNEMIKEGFFRKLLQEYEFSQKDLRNINYLTTTEIERVIENKLDFESIMDIFVKYANRQKGIKINKEELFTRFQEKKYGHGRYHVSNSKELRKNKSYFSSFNYKTFYNTLNDNLKNSEGFPDFIKVYGSEFFLLLCKLLNKDIAERFNIIITKETRLKINSAIAYYVVPSDVISEEEFAAYGYIDDIFLSLFVLRIVADEISYDILQRIWHNYDEDIKEIMDRCYAETINFLDSKEIEDILIYAGLL